MRYHHVVILTFAAVAASALHIFQAREAERPRRESLENLVRAVAGAPANRWPSDAEAIHRTRRHDVAVFRALSMLRPLQQTAVRTPPLSDSCLLVRLFSDRGRGCGLGSAPQVLTMGSRCRVCRALQDSLQENGIDGQGTQDQRVTEIHASDRREGAS